MWSVFSEKFLKHLNRNLNFINEMIYDINVYHLMAFILAKSYYI